MPAPKTTHVAPGCTAAVLIAAPRPVERPHAKRQAPSSGASGVILASAISGITVYSAKVEVPMKCRTGSPPRERRGGAPGGGAPFFFFPGAGGRGVGGGRAGETPRAVWGEGGA